MVSLLVTRYDMVAFSIYIFFNSLYDQRAETDALQTEVCRKGGTMSAVITCPSVSKWRVGFHKYTDLKIFPYAAAVFGQTLTR
jgi:hypothetical protein